MNDTQLGYGVAYAIGELLYCLNATASSVAQLFAQKQLSLTYQAGQGIVYLVPDVCGEFGEFVEARFVLRDYAQQFRLPFAGIRWCRVRVFDHVLMKLSGL